MKKAKLLKYVGFSSKTKEFTFKYQGETMTFVVLENDPPTVSLEEINDGVLSGHCYYQLSPTKEHIFIICDVDVKNEIQAVLVKK